MYSWSLGESGVALACGSLQGAVPLRALSSVTLTIVVWMQRGLPKKEATLKPLTSRHLSPL